MHGPTAAAIGHNAHKQPCRMPACLIHACILPGHQSSSRACHCLPHVAMGGDPSSGLWRPAVRRLPCPPRRIHVCMHGACSQRGPAVARAVHAQRGVPLTAGGRADGRQHHAQPRDARPLLGLPVRPLLHRAAALPQLPAVRPLHLPPLGHHALPLAGKVFMRGPLLLLLCRQKLVSTRCPLAGAGLQGWAPTYSYHHS